MPLPDHLQRFVFLRHGQTDFNLSGTTMGHLDCPMNDTGREESLTAVDHLRQAGLPITHVVTSPLSRCAETARIVCDELGYELVQDSRWMERDWGPYQGRPGTERPDTMSDPVGGETWADFRGRILQAASAFPASRLSMVVAHSGTYRGLLYHMGLTADTPGVPARPLHGIPFLFTRRDGMWRIETIEAPALQELG